MADRVRFHLRNMLDTALGTGSRRSVRTNETPTMYVNLPQLFDEFSRLLEYGGRYVCITGCYNDVTGGRAKAVSRNVHPRRSACFTAFAANGLVSIDVVDFHYLLTAADHT